MAVTISGTDGISTPPVVVQGSTSGNITLAAPAVAGSNTQTLVAATGTLAPLIAGTAVASTSGTSIDFTSIPSWAKRITVMFNGVSTSGNSIHQIQLGAGSITTSGYTSSGFGWNGGTNGTSSTTGIILEGQAPPAASLFNAVMTINNFGNNIWVASAITTATTGTTQQYVSAGSVTLSGTLDRVRITTVNGTDTFDAGSINILYE